MTERPTKRARSTPSGATEDDLVGSVEDVDRYLSRKDSAHFSMVSHILAQKLYSPVPSLYRTWQDEFDRCSPLQSPGIAHVIQLKHELTEDAEQYTPQPYVAFVLEDGSLWRTNPDSGGPDAIRPEFGSPYLTVHRMFSHLKNITTVDFAGARGVILAESTAYAVRDGKVEKIILPSPNPVLLAARDHNTTIVVTADRVLHDISDDDTVEIERTQLNQMPTHAAIIGSTVLLATADDVHYYSTKVDDYITWKQSRSPVHHKFSKCNLALRRDEDDTIKELVTSDYYAAVLTTKGDVFVFGKRMPCVWQAWERSPSDEACKIALPHDHQAKSISCCTTRMAIVTTNGALYTCAIDYWSDVLNVAREVTDAQPRSAFHEATQLPPGDSLVKEAYCTDQYGITVVTTLGNFHHFKIEDEDIHDDELKWSHHWPTIGSRWYLMQQVMSKHPGWSNPLKVLYALKCWLRAVLDSDKKSLDPGTRAKTPLARLREMMEYDYTHRGPKYLTYRVHPIMYLRIIGEYDTETANFDLEPWVTFKEQNLQRVCQAMDVFRTMQQHEHDTAPETTPSFWPNNDPSEITSLIQDSFHDVIEKYRNSKQHALMVHAIISSLPGFDYALKSYAYYKDLEPSSVFALGVKTMGDDSDSDDETDYDSDFSMGFRLRLRLV